VSAAAPPTRSRVSAAAQPSRERHPLTGGHLYQVDAFRVLTFIAVVFVHTTGGTTAADSVTGNGVLNLLHFTREAFFFLTAFVLFHTHYRRPLAVGDFLRRRFLLVGVPYVVWTLFYAGPTLVDLANRQGPGTATAKLGWYLATGNAKYHLYFLVVSLQAYLLFPLLRRLVRRTEGHHGWLFTGSAVLQVAILTEIMYGPGQSGVVGWLKGYCHVLFPTYQFWFVFGALAAVHLEAFQERLGSRPVRAGIALVCGAGAAQAFYLVAHGAGQSPFQASSVFQPVMVVWGTGAVIGLYAIASAWARRRRPGALETMFVTGSELSFGVYLVHPAVLAVVLRVLPGWHAPVSTVAAVAVTITISATLVWVARRTPLSLAIAGRPARRGTPPTDSGGEPRQAVPSETHVPDTPPPGRAAVGA
jgi:peptidoglycan/LPS O-acetylase OafA/YrhL